MRFTIRRRGMVMGTYEGATEAEALDTMAEDEGQVDFATLCRVQGLTRDDHTVQPVQE